MLTSFPLVPGSLGSAMVAGVWAAKSADDFEAIGRLVMRQTYHHRHEARPLMAALLRRGRRLGSRTRRFAQCVCEYIKTETIIPD